MQKSLLFSLGLLIISCCHKQKQSININPDPITLDTSFNTFFTKFNTDSIFQKSHVIFPLTYAVWDSEDGIVEQRIRAKDWKFMDLSYSKENANRQTDAYYQEIAVRNDDNRIYVRFLGIENGIHIEFAFTKVNDTWKLVYWEDSST